MAAPETMKLYVTSGKQKGDLVSLSPQGTFIGKASDNDIVLDGDDVADYHARVEMTANVWMIRDLGSTSGVRLNGVRVTSASPLSIGDDLQIAGQSMIFTDAETAAVAEAKLAAGDADGACEGKEQQMTVMDTGTETDPVRKITGEFQVYIRIIIALLGAVVLLAFILIMVMPPEDPEVTSGGSKNGLNGSAKTGDLHIFYEKLEITADNIFHYQLTIDKTSMQVEVDDIKSKRRLAPARAELSAADLAILEERLPGKDFLALNLEPPRTTRKIARRTRLMVRQGAHGNYADIINEDLPDAVAKLVDIIEEQARDTFGLAGLAISRDELLRRAKIRFDDAESRFRERDIAPQNLFHAVEGFRYVVEYLRGLEETPDFHKRAQELLEEADGLLTTELKEIEFAASMHIRVEEFDQAIADLRRLLAKVPDRTHPKVKWARNRLLDIDQELEKRRKRKNK